MRTLRYLQLPVLLISTTAGVATCVLLYQSASCYFGALDSDLRNQFYPWRVFVHRWFQRGVFPFWNPHAFGGYPTVETQQMLALNPVRLASLWAPPRIGVALEAAANMLIAVAATWFALRRLMGCSGPASAVGVASFVFGAVFAMRVGAGHVTVVAATAWWPLAAATAARASLLGAGPTGSSVREWLRAAVRFTPGELRLLVLLAISNSLVVLAGAPQYIVYLFWIEVVIIVFAARWVPGGLVKLCSTWAVALLLSAPQWLPFLWYLPITGRSSASMMQATEWSELRILLLETIFPFPLGDDLRAPHLFTKPSWEVSVYGGALQFSITAALLLILLARISRPTTRTRWSFWQQRELSRREWQGRIVAAVILLGVHLVMGWWLPGFSSFREPLKARAILALGIALGSAVGFDLVLRRAMVKHARPLLSFVLLLVLIAAATLGWFSREAGWYLAMLRSFPPTMEVTSYNFLQEVYADPALGLHLLKHAAIQTGAVAGLALLLLALKRSRLTGTILLILAVADPFYTTWYAYNSRHSYQENAEMPAFIREAYVPLLAPTLSGAENPWRSSMPSWLINRTHLVEGLFETGGYDPVMPVDANNRVLLAISPGGTNVGTSSSLPMVHRALGRRYDSAHLRDPKVMYANSSVSVAQEVAPGASLVDLERKLEAGHAEFGFGPRADNTNLVTDQGLIKNQRPDPSERVRQIVAGIRPLPQQPDGHGPVTGEVVKVLPMEDPAHLQIQTSLLAPGLLLYRTTWLPGWSVSIDGGKAEKPLCANSWMVAAQVPAGIHTVEFRYRPILWNFALLLSCVGALVVCTLLALSRLLSRVRPVPHRPGTARGTGTTRSAEA